MSLSYRLNRRQLLSVLAGSSAALALPQLWAQKAETLLPAAQDWPPPAGPFEVTFTARERPHQLLLKPAGLTPMWTLSEHWPFPLIRIRRGQRLRATLVNELSEHTSLHWHGMRIANDMDGVPYLTQPPVEPGEKFVYEFTAPDAGTFFFHPHCNTVEQLGRGLAGILLVTGDETQPFDADQICVIKDWRVADDGSFLPFITDRGAGRAGTFGTLTTVNGIPAPQTLNVPANGDVRLRVFNLDNTRIVEVGIAGTDAWMMAVDGNPIVPQPLRSWRMGPAQRIDLAFRAPVKAGDKVTLMNYFAAEPQPLAHITSTGRVLSRPPFEPLPLRGADIPRPDLERAETMKFNFSATSIASDLIMPDGSSLPYADIMCLSSKTFWAINKQSWPEQGNQRLPPPLAVLTRGKSYIFELVNRTPHMHPIHIHGHTFTVLDSNKRELPQHLADTVLLTPKERIRVAFVADNPGDWMFHCHIIEHQETGMMGIIRVS
jgi:FtsP/CotA-like multicopper oxidase with cupredoxin domain